MPAVRPCRRRRTAARGAVIATDGKQSRVGGDPRDHFGPNPLVSASGVGRSRSREHDRALVQADAIPVVGEATQEHNVLATLRQAHGSKAMVSRRSDASLELAQCDDLSATETSSSERTNSAIRRAGPAHVSPGLEQTAPGAQRRSGRLRRRSHDRECRRPRTRADHAARREQG